MKGLSHCIGLLLVLLILTAGCTDDTAPAADISAAAYGAVQPGQVLYGLGDVTGDGIPRGTIDTITFTVGLVPGERSVNLENLSIVYADAIRTESLVPIVGLRGYPPAGSWGILEVTEEAGAPNNRIEYDEKVRIQINPKAPLVPRQVITIIVKPPEGPSLMIRRVAPATIIKENNILDPI